MNDLNYIGLINRFWLLDLEFNFSHLEVHLYFKLLEIDNRLGWKETFKYPNSRMESEIGTRQKNLIDARQKLINSCLIRYEKGTTRDAGVYQLLSDGVTKESNQESNSDNYFQNVDQKDGQKKVIRGALTKQDKTKQENNILPENFKLFSEVISQFDPKFYNEKKWLKCYDELIRIDGYSEENILKTVKHFRADSFWAGNFQTLLKLRTKNKEGIQWIDSFAEKLKNIKSQTYGNKQLNTRADREPATADQLTSDTGW